MSDTEIEQEIQAKGLTAARVTPADVEAAIVSEHYFTAAQGVFGDVAHKSESCVDGQNALLKIIIKCAEAPDALDYLTFCVLVLKNGYMVTGESACASPENFDVELGRKIARQNAVQKIWPLMGYELKTRLASAT